MTVHGLVLHPRVTRGLKAVVMSDSDLERPLHQCASLEHNLMCLQCSKANPSGTVGALEVQHVLAIRNQ